MKTRIVIVDGNAIVRLGLIHFFSTLPDLEVVGEGRRCSDSCPLITRLRPEIVVFDLELEDASGAEVISRFRTHFPDLLGIIYTARGEPEIVNDALAGNIQGYVMKASPPERLAEAIHHVANGRAYLDPSITPTVLAGLWNLPAATASVPAFTRRQIAILDLLATGQRNKDIAKTLTITERTVKFHVSSILRRLEATNRTHAVRIAQEFHLVARG